MNLSRKTWFMLSVIVLGTFITMLNQTLVAPCLPSIMEQMNVDASTVQWLTTGFTLVNAIMIPITAYLQDRFSVRALFIFSMCLFAIGSLGAGWGVNFQVLLGGRLVQAAGAGILMPMSMTVLLVTFPIEKRGSAMGIFGLIIAFAPAIGPSLSGFIVDNADWRIMFVGVAVASVVLVVLGAIFIPAGEGEHKGDSALDVLSVVLSTVGFGGLLYGFSVFGTSGIDIVSGPLMVVGIVCVVWFFIRQTHLEKPMLRVKVLANKKFLIATIIGMLVQASLLAAPVLMPIYVQTLLGQPALISGLLLMPGAIAQAIINPIAGKLFDKHGPRALGLVGMVTLFITTLAFGFVGFGTSLAMLTVLYMLRMVSLAIVNMPVTTWGMNALDTKYMNHGTSVNNTLRQVAASLGTAVVISVSAMVQNSTAPNVGDMQGAMWGINVAFLVCAGIVFVGLVLTIIYVKGKPGETEAVGDEGETAAGEQTHGFAEQNKSVLQTIMKRDVFTLRPDATVQQAMQLFIDKNISACPIVDDRGEPIGFISDGDILKRLSRQSESYMDPIALIATSAQDKQGYNEKLEQIMQLPVSAVGVRNTIGVNVHSDIADVCRVLASNHLKKVPVLEDGHIVGIINRSDVTRYSMEEYLKHRPDLAVVCE